MIDFNLRNGGFAGFFNYIGNFIGRWINTVDGGEICWESIIFVNLSESALWYREIALVLGRGIGVVVRIEQNNGRWLEAKASKTLCLTEKYLEIDGQDMR